MPDNSQPLKAGDVVYLKSGGLAMCVNRVLGGHPAPLGVECVWMDHEEKVQSIVIHVDCLVLAPPTVV